MIIDLLRDKKKLKFIYIYSMWRNDPHNFFPVQPRDLEVILSEEI